MNEFKREIKIYNQLLIMLWVLFVIEIILGVLIVVSIYGIQSFDFDQMTSVLLILYLIAKIALYIIFADKLTFEKDYLPQNPKMLARLLLLMTVGFTIFVIILSMIGYNSDIFNNAQILLFIWLLLSIRRGKRTVKSAELSELNNQDVEDEIAFDSN